MGLPPGVYVLFDASASRRRRDPVRLRDVAAGEDFERFYRTGLEFTLVDHQWILPDETGSFDFVLSNGVLEHVANEYESMKEIYRVLKTGGIFAITFLPAQPLCGLGEPVPYVGD